MDLRSERSWMYKRSCNGVYNIRYLEGVEEFIQFAKKKIPMRLDVRVNSVKTIDCLLQKSLENIC